MFTGIIETIGRVKSIDHREQEGMDVGISCDFDLAEVSIGDSIAINGCCVTVTRKEKDIFWAFLSHETLDKTTFDRLKIGDDLNLERSIRMGDRLDGHLVQGHVEGTAVIIDRKEISESVEITFRLAKEFSPLVVEKGSIAIDGISLTINQLQDQPDGSVEITINVIPHTLKATTIGQKKVGHRVHIESDIFGRYAQRRSE